VLAGVSQTEIIRIISSAPAVGFDLRPNSNDELLKVGVSEDIIKAMAAREAGLAPISRAPSQPAAVSSTSDATREALAPAPVATAAVASDGKTRVFVTDSQSWETRGGSWAGGNRNGWGASSWMAGGARPQTAEIIKTLNQRCPEITVTNNTQKADFVLVLDHEGGKGYIQRHNKIAVFNRDGDAVFSKSTRALGNAVKDACNAMLNSHSMRAEP
jgi:hypothetical protein